MKRSKGFLWLAGGIACVLLAALACGYSLIYNEGRLVYPMDLSTYVFRPGDLPMILALAAVIAYVLALFGLLIRSILHSKEQAERTNTTRKLNPKLGFLGFLGLLGFGGIWTYGANGSIFPSAFSCFLASSAFSLREECPTP